MPPKKKVQKKAQEVPEDSEAAVIDGGSGSQGGSQSERNVVETQRDTSNVHKDSETEDLRRNLLGGKRKRIETTEEEN